VIYCITSLRPFGDSRSRRGDFLVATSDPDRYIRYAQGSVWSWQCVVELDPNVITPRVPVVPGRVVCYPYAEYGVASDDSLNQEDLKMSILSRQYLRVDDLAPSIRSRLLDPMTVVPEVLRWSDISELVGRREY